MSNKYSPCGRLIEDKTGTGWPVETPHPLPVPAGIEQEGASDGCPTVLYGDTANGWTDDQFGGDTHWLARAPLPPVPKVKIQVDIDAEASDSAFHAWQMSDSDLRSAWTAAWNTALTHARKEAQ